MARLRNFTVNNASFLVFNFLGNPFSGSSEGRRQRLRHRILLGNHVDLLHVEVRLRERWKIRTLDREED
jgi:hypothetical protein